MNITVIYATGRKAQSCTYNIAGLLIKELLAGGELFEFQLPRDMPHICISAYFKPAVHDRIDFIENILLPGQLF